MWRGTLRLVPAPPVSSSSQSLTPNGFSIVRLCRVNHLSASCLLVCPLGMLRAKHESSSREEDEQTWRAIRRIVMSLSASCPKRGCGWRSFKTSCGTRKRIQRCAELECSSEAAYNDRVLCRDEGTFETTADGQEHHGDVPWYAVRKQQAKARIVRRLAGYAKVVPVFSGDPRGACVKLKVPSGRTNDWGQEGICVPTKEVRRTCSTFRRVRVS